ncbi:MAG: helix-turn-helix domain-containing protein, partial [Acidimicrobiia bacterium]
MEVVSAWGGSLLGGAVGRISTKGIDWAVVGTRIKRLRRDRSLTQTELIDGLTSASFLSLIESGHRRPSEEVLEEIATRLGATVEELLTGHSPD